MIEKFCSLCKQKKDSSQFYNDAYSPLGLSSQCKECKKIYHSKPEIKKKNAERQRLRSQAFTPEQKANKKKTLAAWKNNNKEYVRLYTLNKTYGLSEQDYRLMLDTQKGLCAICGNKPGGSRPLAVDHCHSSGKIRGLLCYRCNRNLVLLDNEELHKKSVEYRQRSK